MYCSNCGKELGADYSFCPACGAPALKSAAVHEAEPVFELVDRSDEPSSPVTAPTALDDYEAATFGRGKAIASLVLSASSFLALILFDFLAVFLSDYFLLLLFAAPMAMNIIAVIFGIKSKKPS